MKARQAVLVALVGVAVFTAVGLTVRSQNASSAPSERSNLAAGAASSMIAFISEPPGGGYCGVVYVMNADGSGQRRLSTGRVPECGQEGDPAWSPDGRRIAFSRDLASGSRNPKSYPGFYVMNADGSGPRRLSRGPGPLPSWSPDGRKIAFVREGILVVNADGSGERKLTNSAVSLESPPAWSPDGRSIAFAGNVSHAPGRHNIEIYVMNADGTGQRRLTRNAAQDSTPRWSPDGRKIAYVRNWQLWVMNADGSGQRRLTRINGARNVAPAWSPNGRRIAFERRVGRQKYRNTALEYGQCSQCVESVSSQVYVITADGRDARTLAQGGRHPVWSPDGRRIAYATDRLRNYRSWQNDIYVMNADGSGKRNLTQDAGRRESSPVWSPAQR